VNERVLEVLLERIFAAEGSIAEHTMGAHYVKRFIPVLILL
jgi:hypothetical protein